MNANELRIGNYFLESYEGYKIIAGINHHNDLPMTVDAHAIGRNICGRYDLDTIHPIPLTEDILLKCGFEKHSNSNEFWNLYTLKNGWYISQALHIEDSAGVNFGCFYWSGEFIEIKHLHQLQNLFFCLCGKELEISL